MYRFIIFVAFYSDIAANSTDNSTQWDKFDENTWPHYFCKEGKLQSPIDIQANNVIEDYDREFIKYGRLKFKRYDNVLVTGINNGRNIKFSTDGVGVMLPSVSGGPLKTHYYLKEVTFHWLSEHSVDGYKFPMEIHLVHARGDLDMSEALNTRRGLAAISVFCNVSEPVESNVRYDVEDVMDYLPKLMKTGDWLRGLLVDFRKLLLSSSGSYYTYLGSLTEPHCNEVVVWIIFKTPINIPVDVYKNFTEAGEGQHNFRSLQKVYRHTVFEPPKSFIATPAAVQMFIDAVKIIGDFFKNITSALKKGWDTY